MTLNPAGNPILNLQRDVDAFTLAYIEAALWSSTLDPYGECPKCGKEAVLCRWNDARECVCSNCSERQPNHEPPADENYDWTDLADETLAQIVADCVEFQHGLGGDLCGMSETRAGFCFWLSRNGHGSGFFDEDTCAENMRDELQRAAREYGEFSLYVGDDGKIYA